MKDYQYLREKTISGVIWKGLERISAQIVSTVVTIVLARILMPEDYSIISIVTIFFSFCNIFISGGLNTALVQKKEPDSLDFSTILVANEVLALTLYLIMFFISRPIAEIYHKDLLIPVIRIMALSFFINGYKAVVSAKILSCLEFRKFFRSTIVGTFISAIVGIWMALYGFGPWALVAQQMTNNFIDSMILTLSADLKLSFHFSRERFKSLFHFGGKILLASIISAIYDQTKPLIVGIKYTTVDLAYYNKGKSFPDLVASIGSDTLSSSLLPSMAKVQDDKEFVLRMTRRFIQISSFILFPLMIGFLAISEGFVRIVLTDKWLPIVPYLMIFCVSNMLKPIQTGNLQAIRAIGRSDIILILEVIKKTTFFLTILIFVLFTDSPILLAVSGIITSLFASVINMLPNKRLIGYTYYMQCQDLFMNLWPSVIMGAIIYTLNFFSIDFYVLFFLQITIGVIIYCCLNILVKNKSMSYFIKIIHGVVKNENN